MTLKHTNLAWFYPSGAERRDRRFHKDGASRVIAPYVLVNQRGHTAVEGNHDLLSCGMPLQDFGKFLMTIARDTDDDIVCTLYSLVNVGSHHIDLFFCVKFADAFDLMRNRDGLESGEQIVRRKTAGLPDPWLSYRQQLSGLHFQFLIQQWFS